MRKLIARHARLDRASHSYKRENQSFLLETAHTRQKKNYLPYHGPYKYEIPAFAGMTLAKSCLYVACSVAGPPLPFRAGADTDFSSPFRAGARLGRTFCTSLTLPPFSCTLLLLIFRYPASQSSSLGHLFLQEKQNGTRRDSRRRYFSSATCQGNRQIK